MKYVFLILNFLCFEVFSQDTSRNEGVYFTANPKLNFHLKSYFRFEQGNSSYLVDTSEEPTFSYGFSLEAGYFIIPKSLSLGLGVGIEENDSFMATYWPVYLDAKYYFLKERNTNFIQMNVGRVLSTRYNEVNGGNLLIGFGRKLFFTEKLAALMSVNYNYLNIDYANTGIVNFGFSADRYKLLTHGLEFRIGLIF
ncbi:hypothetical protein [Marivirga sp.]|uniref:hypothetical protein n=1 Tax=Marivirga sp. TaxID=2018662 RepID=UPI002D80B044|nr:hypothetical protein [Marivirga sp.]HET8860146.1 hypothetical protein [Marivirga sp.]